jgi:hypothetical protein
MQFFCFNRIEIVSQEVGCYVNACTFSNKTTGSCPVLAFVSLSRKGTFIVIQGKHATAIFDSRVLNFLFYVGMLGAGIA